MTLVADRNVSSLRRFGERPRFVAGDGGDGRGSRRHGLMGKGISVQVPVGTEVWEAGVNGRMLADLDRDGERVVIASGGRGGRGNATFASSTNQYPLLAEKGEEGVDRRLRLELKVLADVGMIGAPNAGKSSLLAAISRARPKIAGYPFTTLEPVLGVVEHKGESFVAADVPGLIEGAHQGVGLGYDFLRHVERTRLLVHVVDGSSEDPVGVQDKIDRELGLFNADLGQRPQIVALNKIDLDEVSLRVDELTRSLGAKGARVVPVSAASGQNINALLDEVLEGLDRLRKLEADEPASLPVLVLRPEPVGEKVRVRSENGAFVVDMPSVSRIAEMIDSDNWDAKLQFYAHLKRKGVVRALEEAGVAHGDTVRIGDMDWEWE